MLNLILAGNGLLDYVFDILMTSIMVFFISRLAITLVYILNIFKKKKLWAIIFISIIGLYNVSRHFNYIIEALTSTTGFDKSDFVYCIITICIVFALCFSMIKQLGGINIKSKRQRQYERDVNAKDRNFLPTIIISFVALLGSLFSAFYYTFAEVDKYTAIISFVTAGVLVGIIVFFIILQIKSNKHTNESKGLVVDNHKSQILKERTCVLIIEDEFDTFIYKDTHKGHIELKKYIGDIVDYYYVQSYGILKHKGEEYDLFGFKTSSFDRGLLNQIKMEKYESEVIKAVIPYLEKNRSKIIELDDNLNPIDSFDA